MMPRPVVIYVTLSVVIVALIIAIAIVALRPCDGAGVVYRSVVTRPDSPTHSLTLRTMWGLWDKTPPPPAYVRVMRFNQEQLGAANMVIHDYDSTMAAIERLDNEIPQLARVFKECKRNVCRADIGRYALIYCHGGIYADIDVIVLNGGAFTDLSRRPPNGQWVVEFEKNSRGIQGLGNYFFSVAAGAPVMKAILTEATSRCLRIMDKPKWSDADVLHSTGPDVVTDVLNLREYSDHVRVRYTTKEIVHMTFGGWRSGRDVSPKK